MRDRLTQLSPAELGLRSDSVVDHLLVKVLTEGSGTQIFSTTFAQWTAREVLRRAEPLTLLVRFAPRQRQRPMNELLADDQGVLQLDPEGLAGGCGHGRVPIIGSTSSGYRAHRKALFWCGLKGSGRCSRSALDFHAARRQVPP